MTGSQRQPGLLWRLYRSWSPALCLGAGIVGPFSPKLAAGLAGRRGLLQRLSAAAGAVRGGVWFHVTSVGEYEQATPIIRGLKAAQPDLPVAVTHFSPSGYEFARRRPCADFHDYLPLDHPGDMDRLVSMWRPRLLVFVKFDCWPNQVRAAVKAGVPVALLAGSLHPRSTRLKPLIRSLYRDVFNSFAHIGVCTEEDRIRFVSDLAVNAPVTVTGDTRAEQVILRYEAAQDGDTATRLKRLGGQLLILGSTWPRDEALWLPVLPRLLADRPELRVVLTPHEPNADRLASLEARLRAAGVPNWRLSRLMAAPADMVGTDHEARVVLTDSIGVLAEIYRAGHLAYVGGSFTTGVHNTMEPAVASMPVLFGPMIHNAEEAGQLVRRGVGFVVERPEAALARARELLAVNGNLSELGERARQVVLAQRGATARSLDAIGPLLDGPV